MEYSFAWDEAKNQENQRKHGVSFELAQYAFADAERLVFQDVSHSSRRQPRYYCIEGVEGGILTVRFTVRNGTIRIIGAGYWRKYRKLYLANR